MREKEKLLVTSNFSFSHNVFKRLVRQIRKNQGLFGKGLCYVHTQLFLALYMCVFILNGSPVAIFRTGFSFVEYCSGSFRAFLQSDN